jgi:dihydroorotase
MLKAVLPFTAEKFGRAILMPNLVPPVRTTADGKAYRERVMAALPPGSKFRPLITCYLTDDTDPDDVERGFRDGLFAAVKLYPAHATTNSAFGVTDYAKITRVLERMEKICTANMSRRMSISSTARRSSSSGSYRSGSSSFQACA